MALGIERPDQIDLEAIAWEHGAVVKYRPLDRCEAMIVGAQRHAIITVNSRAIPVRRRLGPPVMQPQPALNLPRFLNRSV
jgi:hypothetical protein